MISEVSPRNYISQAELDEIQKEVAPMIKVFVQKTNELQVRKEAAQQRLAAAEKGLAEGRKMEAEGQKKLDAANKKLLTTMFYGIFYGKTPVPAEEINKLFTAYLSNESLVIEEAGPGREKAYVRLKSMEAVKNYSKANPSVKSLDFRHFNADIPDFATLADYLATAENIKNIAIKKAVPAVVIGPLNEAISSGKVKAKLHLF